MNAKVKEIWGYIWFFIVAIICIIGFCMEVNDEVESKEKIRNVDKLEQRIIQLEKANPQIPLEKTN